MRIIHPYEYAHFTNGISYHKIFRNQDGGEIYGKGYKFDFREDYNDITNTKDIFIGDKKECILINIDSENNKAAHIQTFNYFEKCDLYKKLPRISGTRILMKTALQYIYLRKGIKKVTITDKAVFIKNGEKITFFILYLFKYGDSYYQKNFGFKYLNKKETINQQDNLKIREKHFINKKKALKELLKYFSEDKVNDFAKNINDGESIIKLTQNFYCPEEMFNIYFTFLKYEFTRKKYYDLFGEILYKKLKNISK